MNYILALMFILFSPNIFATEKLAGGVDVGNARVTTIGVDTRIFKEEEALVNYVNRRTKDILEGKDSEVLTLIEQGTCSKKVKFEKLDLEGFYPSKGKRILNKRHKGQMLLQLMDCLTPAAIQDDRKEHINAER